ncbi:hypothetical protein PENTCL1PPCAC_29296, partial [Pristionchus entomophagus]
NGGYERKFESTSSSSVLPRRTFPKKSPSKTAIRTTVMIDAECDYQAEKEDHARLIEGFMTRTPSRSPEPLPRVSTGEKQRLSMLFGKGDQRS